MKASKNTGKTYFDFSHRFRAASSEFLVYAELTEVSFRACWGCERMGNHPAVNDGRGAISVCTLLVQHPDFHLRNHFLPLDVVCRDQNKGPILPGPGWPSEPGQSDRCLMLESGSNAKCHGDSVAKGVS